MSEALPVEVIGTMGAEEEATSALGTTIAQILTILRTIITYALEVSRRLVAWMGEHPLAALLAIANLAILIS